MARQTAGPMALDGRRARLPVDGGKLAERVADLIEPGNLLVALADLQRVGVFYPK